MLAAVISSAPSAAFALSVQVPTVPHQAGLELVKESEYVGLSQSSALMGKGQYAQALPYLLEVVEKNPINIIGQFNLGTAYLELAKQAPLRAEQAIYLTQAQQAFERVQDLNPDLTLTYFKLGKIALMRGDLGAAKTYYKTGIAIEPGNAALLFNLARVYDQAGERDDAMKYYLLTLEKDPRFIYAYNNLALMYEEKQDFKNAEKLYKQALKKDKKYNLARLNLGNLHAANGRYDTARKLFEEAKAYEPDNAWVYFYLGNMHLRMSNYDEAVSAYNKAVELNPNHATTYYLLAVSLTRLKRMDEALQASLHYVQLAPDGEFSKEMKSLIMAVKLSQPSGLYLVPAPAKVLLDEK